MDVDGNYQCSSRRNANRVGGLGATSRGTRTDLTNRIATVDHADRPGNRNCHGAGRVDEVEELPSSSYRRPRDIRVGVDGKAAGIGGTRTDPDCYLWELRKYYRRRRVTATVAAVGVGGCECLPS